MRPIIFAVAALALSACDTPSQHQAAGCAQSATHNVMWSRSGEPDTLTTWSDGPTCKQAAVVLVARNAQGDPLWTFASTHYDMTVGGAAPPDADNVTQEQMQSFLASWANVSLRSTADLPAWSENMSRPGEGVETLAYESALDREAYETLRGRGLPIICYAAAAAAVQCLAIEPGTRAPILIAAYGS